jgi:hypothetical protein
MMAIQEEQQPRWILVGIFWAFVCVFAVSHAFVFRDSSVLCGCWCLRYFLWEIFTIFYENEVRLWLPLSLAPPAWFLENSVRAMTDSCPEQKNILQMLLRRETFPGRDPYCRGNQKALHPKRAVECWTETDSIINCAAMYCPLRPAPRSTIAAAFSPDGELLASTQCVSRLFYKSFNKSFTYVHNSFTGVLQMFHTCSQQVCSCFKTRLRLFYNCFTTVLQDFYTTVGPSCSNPHRSLSSAYKKSFWEELRFRECYYINLQHSSI